MAKIQLTDKSGHWFDVETSIKLPERTWFDGSNRISANTGSQWSHETLYYTRKGNWILEQSRGHADHYVMVDREEAIGWVSHNDIYGGDEFNQLPEEAQHIIREQLKTLEV
jgi:hypothetical protein